MANPYFNAVYYLQQNPDVFAAGYTVDTAWNHYAQFGANEGYANGGTVRAPNPWFDVKYYLNNNPDLIAAGITPAMALDHFTTYGMTAAEDRAPNSTIAGNPITEASLLAYAKGNADLQTAFGIPADATTLTAAQQNALISHFYQYGYSEGRADPPTTVVLPNPNQGQTFTLTTGVDNIEGSAGNDTINGGALAPDGTTAATTLNALDVINGGGGTDTLVLDTTGDQNQSIGGTITNVENLTFLGSGSAIAAVDASNFSGAIRFQQTTDTSVSVTGATGQNLVLDRVADATVLTAGYAAAQATAMVQAASVLGDATFSISGTGLKTANLTVDKTVTGKSVTVTDTGNTTESASIAASGASTVTVTSTALKSVTVSGEGAVSLTTTTAPTTSVDASASTGGVTLVTALATTATFTGGSGKDSITQGASTKAVAMGAGDDTVTWSGAALGSGGSTDGGAGTDTINLTAANAATVTSNATLGAAFAASISNFEKFGIGATGAATTVDATYIDGMTHLVSAGTVVANTLTINNLAANSTFEMTAAAAAAVALNLKDSAGTSDVLNLKFSATDGFTSTAAITAAGVETLNITTDDTDTTAPTTVFTAPITAAAVKTVVVSGDVGIDLTGLNATTLTSFDASGVTATGAAGAVTLVTGNLAADAVIKGGAGNDSLDASAAVTKTVNIEGGAGNDSITGSATKVNTLNGGEGNDTIVGGSAADTIMGGDGNDIISGGAGLDQITGGAGNDTFNIVTNANGNIFATILDASAGDMLSFTDRGTETFATTKLSLGGTAVFQDYLNLAAAGDGSTNGAMSWFQFGSNTYVVQDLSAAGSFVNGTDIVVELTGMIDLSTATGAGTNVLTLA